ncbi:unnamed protein product [Ilex paraguariensis]|uniref:Protein kinase domain-containing protein n=1 Tax=Ilex paraguariensis TaxID=185542 RepID=A0ABC8UJJ4_9AQUA
MLLPPPPLLSHRTSPIQLMAAVEKAKSRGILIPLTRPASSAQNKIAGSYKETKKLTDNNFSTMIGLGGFRTVFKAEFSDGLVGAMKRMNKVLEQAEDGKEIELLARQYHCHLVALRGFCIAKQERFFVT